MQLLPARDLSLSVQTRSKAVSLCLLDANTRNVVMNGPAAFGATTTVLPPHARWLPFARSSYWILHTLLIKLSLSLVRLQHTAVFGCLHTNCLTMSSSVAPFIMHVGLGYFKRSHAPSSWTLVSSNLTKTGHKLYYFASCFSCLLLLAAQPISSAHTSLACTPLFTKHRTAACHTYRHYSSFLQFRLLPATSVGFLTDLATTSIYFEVLVVWKRRPVK